MEQLQLITNEKTIYNIHIRLLSEKIEFYLESEEIIKRIIRKEYSFSEMKENNGFFQIKFFKDIESMFTQLKTFIQNYKNNPSSSSIKLIESKDEIKLQFKTNLIGASIIKFVFKSEIDINASLSEIIRLYTNLKKEKDEEINNLKKINNKNEKKFEELKKEINNLKIINNQNEKKFEELKKEIADLKDEIKILNEKHDNKIKELNDEFNEKIDEIYKAKEYFEGEYSDKIDELTKNINNYYSFMCNIFLILTLKNPQNFKCVLENHYNQLVESSDSVLFNPSYKESYNVMTNMIFENINLKNGTNINEIKHFKVNEKSFFKSDNRNWNAFLINNVIFNMIFDDEIEINKNGVEQTLKKIYKLDSELEKNYNSELEKAENDTKQYIEDFKVCDIIKGIKKFIVPNIKNQLEQQNENLLTQ